MKIILEMTLLDWLIFWLGIGAHAPLILGIFRQKHDKSQTFVTWILYFMLDTITFFSYVNTEKDSGFIILLGFSVGSFIMSIILFYQKRFIWTQLETIISSLIIGCIVLFKTASPYWALLFGIASESIVGIYLIIKTWQRPKVRYNFTAYVIFLIVSILAIIKATISDDGWSLSKVGYPISETILNVVILIPLILKWRKKKIKKMNLKIA